jgi:hypothetical protein
MKKRKSSLLVTAEEAEHVAATKTLSKRQINLLAPEFYI